MKAKLQLKQSMQEEQILEALNAHWHMSAVGDASRNAILGMTMPSGVVGHGIRNHLPMATGVHGKCHGV